ncbi:MAG: thermonuclease family protein [Burkholderiaceae bacterium]|nr:thermonuclease family protein [Burkholderiaceae bacterium]
MKQWEARPGGRVRPVLLMAVAAALAIGAGWLRWTPPIEALPAAAFPFTAEGRVVSVDDGDSFVFERRTTPAGEPRRIRVRLHAVDTPELVQSHGLAARDALAHLTRQRPLALDCYKRDPRGRAVCRVTDTGRSDAARDIEIALLQQGFAWHYRAFSSEQTAAERTEYAAAEADARALRRGLWQQDAPMPPWACRERLRSAATCD